MNLGMSKSPHVPEARDDSIATRPSLLHRLQASDDPGGWDEFFAIYWPFCCRFALAGGLNHADAQEAAQATLIAVWRALPQFRYDPERAAFKTWLIGILRCRIADLHRRRRTRGEVLSLDDTDQRAVGEALMAPASPAAPEAWEADWDANVLRAARERVWKRLSQRELQIYQYYEAHHRNASTTARDMEISTARVYVARYRVERELRKEVQRLRRQWL